MASTARRTAAKLHLLTTKQVQHAAEGDHSDGGGLLLRVRGESCSWVLRYTSPTGRRREMGLGVCHRASPAQSGESLMAVRDAAYKARELLRQGLDPIEQRNGFNRDGLCWTLDREIAEQFPTLNRYRRPGHEPLLMVGTVPTSEAVLKDDRNEAETIAPKVTVLKVERHFA